MRWSPDENARGLSAQPVDPLRYDGHTNDVTEVAGLMRVAMPEGVRVLDVGCGTGGLTALVNEGKGNEVIGLEPDSDRAAMARRRGLDVVTGELNDVFLEERGPFDVVIFADVLEHLPAPAQVLESTVRCLRPSGLVLISVPNVAHWSVRANLLVGRFEYEPVGIMDSTHLRWFTEKSLRSFVTSTGLEIVSVRYAAGTTLPVYYRSVFQFIPKSLLRFLVRLGTRALPRLFASQYVILARKLG